MDHLNRRLEIIGLVLLAFIICAAGVVWINGLDALQRLAPVLGIGAIVVSLLGWRLGRVEIHTAEQRSKEEPAVEPAPGTKPVASGASPSPKSDAEASDHTDQSGVASNPGQEHAFVRALHDEVSEHVSAIRSMGQAITRRATDPAMKEASALVLESADRLDSTIRRVLVRHTGGGGEAGGLSDAVSALVSQTQEDIAFRDGQRKVVLRLSPEVDALPAAIADASLGIARQALSNAVEHSGASQIEVNLRVVDDHVVLQVTDNGVGMPDPIPSRNGLNAMADRAVAVGGVFELGKSRLGGVVARARLPVGGQAAKPTAKQA